MGKSRRWRKAMLEWLKEMWRNCVGCNTKHGEWMLPPKFGTFVPLLFVEDVLIAVTILVLILMLFGKFGG